MCMVSQLVLPCPIGLLWCFQTRKYSRVAIATLESLDADRHAPELFTAYAKAPDGRDWTYMPVGPFTDLTSYKRWAIGAARSIDPRHYAVIDYRTSRAVGTIALLRQNPGHGSIEVGFVAFSPELQRTVAATEAQFL